MATSVEFKHPPVVETVLGIQFQQLRGFTNAHLGAFWREVSDQWPRVKDAPVLDEQFEVFGKPASWRSGAQLRLTQEAAARIQARNKSDDRMIQVQNGRLHYNWLGVKGGVYPRYRNVRPEFDRLLGDFETFVRDAGLGDLVPNQWEVTYVNHMPKGTVWQEPKEWPAVFQSLPGLPAIPAGIRLEGLGGHWHFEIEPRRGRLHVEIGHGFVAPPQETELLTMKLTARGPTDKEAQTQVAIDEGLNLGHDVVVESFRDLTSERAHDYWNREA